MGALKKLAGQTAIYGVSSILARFLNFLLTPFYTSENVFSEDQFGIITEMYAYVAFLIILLTYGMETSFFRFSTKEGINKNQVYKNALYSVTVTSAIFIIVASLFSQPIANWLAYPDHNEYIIWFAIIVGLDALASIPLAKLRKENNAKRFAIINIVNVGVNIFLNLYFLWYCKGNFDVGNSNWLIDLTYHPSIGVGYVFIANLIASIIKFLMLGGELQFKGSFQWALYKDMFRYAYPMLFVGLAGIVNEMLDRIILKDVVTEIQMEKGMNFKNANTYALTQLGIYGANYKIAMIVAMFLQAYRYAAEPFFFNQEKEKDSPKTYAKVMNFFVIAVSAMFLIITMNLQIIKYFTPNAAYWEGLHVVPILLAANVLLGIYINQSIWYKLSSKTMYGAAISLIGAIITVVLNFSLIPYYGYDACAWATLLCYATMLIISLFWSRKHYPIKYNFKKLIIYAGFAFLLYLFRWRVGAFDDFHWGAFLVNNLLIIVFLAAISYLEHDIWKLIEKKVLKR